MKFGEIADYGTVTFNGHKARGEVLAEGAAKLLGTAAPSNRFGIVGNKESDVQLIFGVGKGERITADDAAKLEASIRERFNDLDILVSVAQHHTKDTELRRVFLTVGADSFNEFANRLGVAMEYKAATRQMGNDMREMANVLSGLGALVAPILTPDFVEESNAPWKFHRVIRNFEFGDKVAGFSLGYGSQLVSLEPQANAAEAFDRDFLSDDRAPLAVAEAAARGKKVAAALGLPEASVEAKIEDALMGAPNGITAIIIRGEKEVAAFKDLLTKLGRGPSEEPKVGEVGAVGKETKVTR
ncbi:MAG: hypothetical protein EB060_09975 [Proteobacteria bacterium]|nr:hypothetical protein [Pseudomonadota bacterium]